MQASTPHPGLKFLPGTHHEMPGLGFAPLGLFRGVIMGTAWIVDDQGSVPLKLGVRHRNRGQQGPGIRVQGPLEEPLRGSQLNQATPVYDGNAVGDEPDHRQVVGYEQV